MLELDAVVDRRDFAVELAFDVRRGERLALYGPSGAGKTTVLEVAAGFVVPRAGHVALDGETLTATAPRPFAVPVWQRRIGLLRQRTSLFPHLDVAANLAYDRRRHGRDRAEVERLAARLEITSLLEARPAVLSGGQAQRVALGRLLLSDSRALLLDEPFAGLDGALRRSTAELVAEVTAERDMPAVLVAHELAEAQSFGHLLGVVDEGHLLQLGSPHDVVASPASRRVAELVGYRSFVRSAAGNEEIGVHPSRVVPGAHPDAGTVLRGSVVGSRAAGARFEVDLSVEGTVVVCELADVPGASVVEVTVLDAPRFSIETGRRSP